MAEIPDTPVTLLARLAAETTGESELSWVRFFNLYQPVIRHFAELNGAWHDSEDVAQEVLVKLVDVFRSGAYSREKGKFRTYLGTLVRRLAINRWKRAHSRQAEKHISIDASSQGFEILVDSTIQEELDAKWIAARHAAALDHVLTKTALSAKTKAIYRAYVIDGRGIGDVAAEFGVPRNVVSQAKTRIEKMVAEIEAILAD